MFFEVLLTLDVCDSFLLGPIEVFLPLSDFWYLNLIFPIHSSHAYTCATQSSSRSVSLEFLAVTNDCKEQMITERGAYLSLLLQADVFLTLFQGQSHLPMHE
jgi:hypothetical protein